MQTIPFSVSNHEAAVFSSSVIKQGDMFLPGDVDIQDITMVSNADGTSMSCALSGMPGMFNLTFRGVEETAGSITVTNRPTGVVLPVPVSTVPELIITFDLSGAFPQKIGIVLVPLNEDGIEELMPKLMQFQPEEGKFTEDQMIGVLDMLSPELHILIINFSSTKAPQTFTFANGSALKAHGEAMLAAQQSFAKAA